MNGVLVVSNTRKPLMPTSQARARMLLTIGKAAVLRRFPFTIILKDRADGNVQPVRVKVDPGSRETGISLVNEANGVLIFAMVLVHRGRQVKSSLDSRRAIRRSRRNRNTRHRAPRFDNRARAKGWLPPSLQHRVETVSTWTKRFGRFAPIVSVSMELVRFDLQQMENPEICGVEYQQGTLAGYEVREYLLGKWDRRCSYCGAENVPLQVEHIVARTNGGTNRINNLCLACEPCNVRKGTQLIDVFLKKKPEVLAKVLALAKHPLMDAAAVNATRWALFTRLKDSGLPIEAGSGGKTKFNRSLQGYPKAHWIDAACVGQTGEAVILNPNLIPLVARATGHGCRQVTRTDRFGFPRQAAKAGGSAFGFRTGDMVRAVVPKGKHVGVHVGKVAIRATGSFDVLKKIGRAGGISYKHCQIIHRRDGYVYF